VKLSSALAERTRARQTPGVLLPAVKQGMLSTYTAESDRRWDIIHPSELSHQKDFCPRAVYLRITEGPLEKKGSDFDFVRDNIFDEGHTIHAKWQQRLRESTPLFGNWRCLVCGVVVRAVCEPREDNCGALAPNLMPGKHIWEYKEITLDAEHTALLVGHADGGAWTTLAEIKSIGEGSVRIEEPELYKAANGDLKALWRDITRPFKTHVNQVDIYLWICREMGYPFTSAEFIYESKWNQQVKNFTIEYDERRSLRLVDQAKAIKYAVDHREEPECRFPGTCDNCKPYDERRAAPRRRTARTTGRK
jgi:CRISPR/Cas system-associated exonuclease Cas4 (RecB family)